LNTTDSFVTIGVYVVMALMMAISPLVLARLVAPHNPGIEKNRAYECGVVEDGDPWGQVRIQFYLYALVFLVFDVEALFLYPWAVYFKEAGVIGLVEVLVFIGFLVLAWLYAIRTRALRWE
jgi:NADH-quinone oxidoreductase subunit A